MPDLNRQFLNIGGLTEYDGLIKNYISSRSSGYIPQLDSTNQALVFNTGTQPIIDTTNNIIVFEF